jgi:thioredoxin reductase (NADPH)
METIKHKVAVLGSGPAGYSAAIYLSRGDIETDLYQGPEPGGQLATTTLVENYAGFADGIQGPDLMEAMQKQAAKFGAIIILNAVESIKQLANKKWELTLLTGEQKEYDAVIAATGASYRWLGLEDEDKFKGKGLSACATCDAFFYKGKNVFVVGGGDSAMEEALFISKFAASVTIINRTESYKASKIMYDRAKSNPKISFINNSSIIKYNGGKELESVTLIDTLTKVETTHSIDGVFLAIGHVPNTGYGKDYFTVDALGYIMPLSKQFEVNDLSEVQIKIALRYRTATALDGLFVAGDVQDPLYRQAISAAGSGCEASLDAMRYLESL